MADRKPKPSKDKGKGKERASDQDDNKDEKKESQQKPINATNQQLIDLGMGRRDDISTQERPQHHPTHPQRRHTVTTPSTSAMTQHQASLSAWNDSATQLRQESGQTDMPQIAGGQAHRVPSATPQAGVSGRSATVTSRTATGPIPSVIVPRPPPATPGPSRTLEERTRPRQRGSGERRPQQATSGPGPRSATRPLMMNPFQNSRLTGVHPAHAQTVTQLPALPVLPPSLPSTASSAPPATEPLSDDDSSDDSIVRLDISLDAAPVPTSAASQPVLRLRQSQVQARGEPSASSTAATKDDSKTRRKVHFEDESKSKKDKSKDTGSSPIDPSKLRTEIEREAAESTSDSQTASTPQGESAQALPTEVNTTPATPAHRHGHRRTASVATIPTSVVQAAQQPQPSIDEATARRHRRMSSIFNSSQLPGSTSLPSHLNASPPSSSMGSDSEDDEDDEEEEDEPAAEQTPSTAFDRGILPMGFMLNPRPSAGSYHNRHSFRVARVADAIRQNEHDVAGMSTIIEEESGAEEEATAPTVVGNVGLQYSPGSPEATTITTTARVATENIPDLRLPSPVRAPVAAAPSNATSSSTPSANPAQVRQIQPSETLAGSRWAKVLPSRRRRF